MRGSPDISYANDFNEFGEFQHATYGSTSNESDLKAYMDEKMCDYREDLDILEYWKSVEFKYHALSFMTRDILSAPITIIASESSFNIGGCILDKYQSCLLPENVEALLCTNDWLHGTPGPKDELCLYLEGLANANDVPSYVKENPFCQSAITSSHFD
ncbi:unnamed protein product [Lupinus luteus]|uniref:HAT C-terminal dimerisation domain-containing protein n=1 Tax=Lupinus luteus TaxID=3873 RepID=A0AAV1WKC7_LUPLU